MGRKLSKALIVGGGVAGPILAVFLRRQGFAVELYEAAGRVSDTGGALGLAANGMAVLAAAGVLERVRDVSVTTGEWRFENQKGGVLARVIDDSAARYGHAGVMITRAALHRVLVEYAEENGVSIAFNKRLVQVEDEPGRLVAARFADGLTAEGDFLVGADGIGSQVRRSIMPEAPEPVYTGMMAPGGFSACLDPNVRPRSRQCVHFILGRNGFFGYFNTLTQHGPRTVWWSTAAAPLRPRIEMNGSSREDLRRRLMALHGDWARPIPQLIESATDLLDIAIHDVPSLPRWSAGRVILIGDAAHAVAPHSGQGASMALEDAMYLAKLFREANGGSLETVFTRFEAERRPRTDKVIALGRRNGRSKAGMSALAYWIQQQMIRMFVPLTLGRRQDWLLGYKIK